MNSSKTYLKKINAFIVLTAIISQLFLITTTSVSYLNYKFTNSSEIAEFQQAHYEKQLNSLFMKIDNIIQHFSSSGAIKLCSDNILKMPDEQLGEKYEKICEALDASPLTERYFSGYWIIGKNSNHLAFSNIDGQFSDYLSYRFDYIHLFNDYNPTNFSKNYRKIFIFDKNNMSDFSIPASEVSNYNKLFDTLDGKPIYFTMQRENLCILILNESYFNRIFSPNTVNDTSVVIENSSGEMVYSRFVRNDAKNFKNNSFKGGTVCKNSNYTLHIKNHIKFTLTDVIFILFIIAVFVISILHSVRLAEKHSRIIMEPYSILNNFFKLTGMEKKVSKFDYSAFSHSIKKRSGISRSCFFAIINTTIIPSLTALIVLVVLLNFCTQYITDSIMTVAHSQLKEEFYDNIDFFITNAQKNDNDPSESSRLNYTVILDEDFSLLDHSLTSLSHVSFSDFNRQLKSTAFDIKNSALININKDFFDDQALGIVHPQSNGTYELNIIKSTVIENAATYSPINFIITDHNSNTVTQSIMLDNAHKKDILSGSHNIIVHNSPFHEFGWTLYTFSDKAQINQNLYNVIQFDFIIVFAFLILMLLIGWYYSIFFVRPIEHVMSLMVDNNADSNQTENTQTGNNEIDEMLYLYNNMIDHIKIITNEKIQLLKKEEELKALKHHAELIALQQQINPHFIYNTLEIISLSAMNNGDFDTSRIVSKLSKIFRYPINKKSESVFLYDEIQNIQNYLDIWDMRFPGRYHFNFDIDPDTKLIPTLKLILQPIVENCMMHAFDQMMENCILSIKTCFSGDNVEITITDNGCGMDKETLDTLQAKIKNLDAFQTTNNGIGLCNVYQRLLIFYRNSVDIHIKSVPQQGTTIKISFKPNLREDM